jgi:hypothetical protein
MPTVNDNYPKKDNAEMSDAQLKELAIQQMQRQEVKNSGFPTEMISLPSQGKVYPETNPLSSGKIEMKYMTAREEDILTSQNLIRQGIVLEKLMQSMIVSPINYNDLVIGDYYKYGDNMVKITSINKETAEITFDIINENQIESVVNSLKKSNVFNKDKYNEIIDFSNLLLSYNDTNKEQKGGYNNNYINYFCSYKLQ